VAYGGACTAPIATYCEATLHGATYGSANQFASYPCATGTLSGGEVYYKLENPVSGTVTVKLTNREADLDLIVVGADAIGGCDPTDECLAASQTAGSGGVEQVTLSSVQGETYYLIVDSPTGAAGAFTLDIACDKHL
jgi:hypothetical protein